MICTVFTRDACVRMRIVVVRDADLRFARDIDAAQVRKVVVLSDARISPRERRDEADGWIDKVHTCVVGRFVCGNAQVQFRLNVDESRGQRTLACAPDTIVYDAAHGHENVADLVTLYYGVALEFNV